MAYADKHRTLFKQCFIRRVNMDCLLRLSRALVALTLLSFSINGFAGALMGQKQILLVDKKGNETLVGTVAFHPQDEGSRYELHMDHGKFS